MHPLSFPLRLPRSQTCGVALVCLVALGCTRTAPGTDTPSSIRRIPADLADNRLDLVGVYADGWTAPMASLSLSAPDGKQVLAIRGVIPKIDRDDFKTDLEVRVDGNLVIRKSLGLGDFSIQAAAPSGAGKHRVGMVFTSVQLLPGGDGRPIGTRLSFAGFEPPSLTAAPGSDIVSKQGGVRLGPGWNKLETVGKETFRAAANDAQLVLTAGQSGTRRVMLVIESGSPAPVILQALDASGLQVDAVEVGTRGTVNLFLPVTAGRDTDFRLHLNENSVNPSAARPAFRIFRIEAY